jgi:hypothetical protein
MKVEPKIILPSQREAELLFADLSSKEANDAADIRGVVTAMEFTEMGFEQAVRTMCSPSLQKELLAGKKPRIFREIVRTFCSPSLQEKLLARNKPGVPASLKTVRTRAILPRKCHHKT